MNSPERDAVIKKASLPNGCWSIHSIAAAIGKSAAHDTKGNITLNGTYTIGEIEAILESAYMDRASAWTS